MSRFTRKVRIAVLRSMEALGTTAANLASNAKLRVQELTLETRRREILSDFSLQAFELWQKGVALPPPLGDMLTELSDIDSRLSVLRAQKYAKLNPDGSGKPTQPDEPKPTADEALTLPTDEALFGSDDGTEEAETSAELTATEETFPVADATDTPAEEHHGDTEA